MLSSLQEYATSFCFEDRAQASVEAALLLPILMLLLVILLQPAFVLYTKAVMGQAAAEGARVLMTYEGTSNVSKEAVLSYVRRRLSAVPNVNVFHAGGLEDWLIDLEGDAGSEKVSVTVEGSLKPLPLLGIVASMLGEARGNELVLKVKVTQIARPSWLEGSYTTWVSEWS